MSDIIFNKVLQEFDDEELISLAQKLISIPSYHGLQYPEKEVAEYLYGFLQENGMHTVMVNALEGRPNVICEYGNGDDCQKTLMLNGHMDTVDVKNMTIDPFKGNIENGNIYGRGSVDMKSAVAAMAMALVFVKRAGVELGGKVYFAGVVDEERGAEGTRYIAKNGPKTKYAIVGECTDMEIHIGHRGLEWIQIRVEGKYAHGGTPESGINAIEKMNKIITKISDNLLPSIKKRTHPIVGPAFLNYGTINGGTQPSTVAGECVLKLDRRWLPSETRESIIDELNDIISEMQRDDKDLKAHASSISTKDSMGLGYPPMVCSPSSPIVRSLEKVSMQLRKSSRVSSFPAWTDGAILSHFGTETVIFGPGHLSSAHSDKEFCPVQDIIDTCKAYIYVILDICR